MRIWSLHLKYLDPVGLVALWREALLAQAVLQGRTRGYRNHPQLLRFKGQADPEGAIAVYLQHVHEEARRRGYRFDSTKIGTRRVASPMTVTRGQLLYEWEHLKAKLSKRDVDRYERWAQVGQPEPHPLFVVVEGEVEVWEVGTFRRAV